MLEVRDVRKRFGELIAVDGVSFALRKGESVGLLGPNGAGKTTTVSMICGLIRPDSGEILIDGRPLVGDTDPAKRKIGLVTQDIALYDELTARDNLTFFGSLYDLDAATLSARMEAALALVELTERAGDRVKNYSGGMKRRLNLAAALLHDPELVILDEPTVGVDPQSRNAIFENLESLKAAGKSILYTTHYMEEAERLCDRIVIIDHGRVAADDDLRGLFRRLPAANRLRIELESTCDDGLLEALRGVPGVATVVVEAGVLTVGVADMTATPGRLLARLHESGHTVGHLAGERPDLEAVFLSLTGRSLRDS